MSEVWQDDDLSDVHKKEATAVVRRRFAVVKRDLLCWDPPQCEEELHSWVRQQRADLLPQRALECGTAAYDVPLLSMARK